MGGRSRLLVVVGTGGYLALQTHASNGWIFISYEDKRFAHHLSVGWWYLDFSLLKIILCSRAGPIFEATFLSLRPRRLILVFFWSFQCRFFTDASVDLQQITVAGVWLIWIVQATHVRNIEVWQRPWVEQKSEQIIQIFDANWKFVVAAVGVDCRIFAAPLRGSRKALGCGCGYLSSYRAARRRGERTTTAAHF